ncbi:hypothetical protein T492DRAFT_844728 [Pavlovales sp. CCMP2436]|nr:hypothetical protein T492DRAFT_844728 [Pavlovales sp. CCMP2436]
MSAAQIFSPAGTHPAATGRGCLGASHTHKLKEGVRILGAGELTQRGVANLRALATLAHSQTLSYDFGPYNLDFPTDTPALILSRGKPLSASAAPAAPGGAPPCVMPIDDILVDPSTYTVFELSILQFPTFLNGTPPCVMPIDNILVDAATVDATLATAAATTLGGLSALRAYLTLAAESPSSLTEAIAMKAQNDFVAARQADATVSAETLHLWCSLARLRAQAELSPEYFRLDYLRQKNEEKTYIERELGLRAQGAPQDIKINFLRT